MSDITLNRYNASGTTAERVAFVPDPPSVVSGPEHGYFWYDTDDSLIYSYDFGLADWVAAGGIPGIDQLTGDVTAGPGAGSQATTIANNAVTTAKINNATVTLAKIANAAANSKLLGSGAAGSGNPYSELTLGTNLSITGTTLNAADTDTGITQLTGDVTAGPGNGSQAATLANTTVTPGSYTATNLTVDAKGRITAAANGSAGGGTVTHTAGALTANQLMVGNGSADSKVSDLTGDVTTSGGVATTAKTALKTRPIAFVIDGGGSALTTGVKGDIYVPYACTITAVTMLADQSGSVVVDIWKDTYANYPPTVADTIVASAKPTITTAVKSQDNTLTGWTTSVSAGDTLRFNVDSITTITRLALTLTVTV